MNECNDREARSGSGVGDRSPAAISVPAKDRAGEAQAAHGIRPHRQFHAPCRHLENICAAGGVEHVGPIEKARERLAVGAVADEAEAGRRRDVARDAAQMSASAAKRKVQQHVRHLRRGTERSDTQLNVKSQAKDPSANLARAACSGRMTADKQKAPRKTAGLFGC